MTLPCNSCHLLMENVYFKTGLKENLFNLLRDDWENYLYVFLVTWFIKKLYELIKESLHNELKKISLNGFGGKFCWVEFRGAPCKAKDAFGYCSVLLIFIFKLFLEAKKRKEKKRLEIALG